MAYVRDAVGRRLVSRAPSWAKAQVARGHAEWVHAPHVQPDLQHGTVRLLSDVRTPPPEPLRVDLLDPCGVPVRALHPSDARQLQKARPDLVTIVGLPNRGQGPRCLLLLRPLEDSQLEALVTHETQHLAQRLADLSHLRSFVAESLGPAYNVTDLAPVRQTRLLRGVELRLARNTPEARQAADASDRTRRLRQAGHLLREAGIESPELAQDLEELSRLQTELASREDDIVQVAGRLHALAGDTVARLRARLQEGDGLDPALATLQRVLQITAADEDFFLSRTGRLLNPRSLVRLDDTTMAALRNQARVENCGPNALAARLLRAALGGRQAAVNQNADLHETAAEDAGGGRVEDDGNQKAGLGGGRQSISNAQAYQSIHGRGDKPA